MSAIQTVPPPADIDITQGQDFSFDITVTDSGVAKDLSDATIDVSVLRNGAVAVAMTDSLGGAGDNVITASLTDSQTGALEAHPSRYRWSCKVTISSETAFYVAGRFGVYRDGETLPATSSGNALTINLADGITVDLTLPGGMSLAALDGRLDSAFFVPPMAFRTIQGFSTATQTETVGVFANRGVGWEFDAASDKIIGTTFGIPPHWATFEIDCFYYTPSATGDWVTNRRVISKTAEGDGIAGGGLAQDTITVSSGGVTAKATTGPYAATGLAYCVFQIGRDGTDAADTLTESVYLVGVRVRRAS